MGFLNSPALAEKPECTVARLPDDVIGSPSNRI
jgi:hypothetical protein